MTHAAGTILFQVPSGNCASKSVIVPTSVRAIHRVTEVAASDEQHCYNCQLRFWLDRSVATLTAWQYCCCHCLCHLSSVAMPVAVAACMQHAAAAAAVVCIALPEMLLLLFLTAHMLLLFAATATANLTMLVVQICGKVGQRSLSEVDLQRV